MKNKKIRYNTINTAILLFSAAVFCFEYKKVEDIFYNTTVFSFLILIATVILVHFVKMFRLYMALYGSGITHRTYLKTYCKIIPVSLIIPCKLGEFFRIYCFGEVLGGTLKGIVIILMDRFMDTAALLTVIFLVLVFRGGKITIIVYFLMLFFVLVLFLYKLFPGVYMFWKGYLLQSAATKHKLTALNILEVAARIYSQMESVVEGRGAILYILSLIAWGVEIGGIRLMGYSASDEIWKQGISDYLLSAINGKGSIPLKQFVFISVVLLSVMYFIIELRSTVTRKKGLK